jgi:signal transduction histidine kinase
MRIRDIKISTQIFIGFVVVFTAVFISISVSNNNSEKILKSFEWVEHTHEVLTQLENIENRLIDLETGQRGFLITGRDIYLEPFNSSLVIVYERLEKLKEETSDNPNQTKRIEGLKKIVDAKVKELKQTIKLRKEVSYEAAKAIVDNDSGLVFMEQIRAQIAEIRNEELRLLDIRRPEPEKIHSKTDSLLIGLLFFTLLAVVSVFFLISRRIGVPINALKNGAKIIAQGNLDYKFGIDTKNELGLLAKSFETMLLQLKETMASKDLLESEVESRKRFEQSLINTKKSLEKKNKELQQFTYITSHDLQEPLNSLISFSEFLEDEKDNLSKLGQQSVGHIGKLSLRMKDFISSLLEYSRIGRGNEKSLITINELIANLKTDLHHLIEQKKAKIEYIGDDMKFMAFEADIMKLFQNLVVNGIKYNKEDNVPEIIINAIEKNDCYEFSVADNGIGIEEKHFDKIFEVFQRLHKRSEFEGTGIGLSYCQKVVEIHNGKIWLTSELGKGTTFYFTIEK